MSADTRDRLMEWTYRSTPVWALCTTLFVPYIIVLLSLRPTSTSPLIRAALTPLAFWAVWRVIQTYTMERPDDVQLYEFTIGCTLSVMIRYAFTSTPPTFHPLPRRPPLHFIRSNRFFQAFNIIASDYRHINMPPNPPLKQGRSYLRSVASHFTGFILHVTLMDLILYPGFMIDPTGLGCPTALGRRSGMDLEAFCAARTGSGSGFGCWFWFALAVALATLVAMMGTYHMFAFLGIGSGFYLDEEWPDFMVEPWKADSLNDLWGKRYHQMLRDTFILWANPFSRLPRPIHLMSIFLASAAFHIIVYKPMTRQLILSPYLTFYLSQGLGCVLERAYGRYTGQRVRGWWGRIWMLVFLVISGRSMVNEYYRIGVPGMMRGALVAEGMSPAAWLAYALGWGQDPRDLKTVK